MDKVFAAIKLKKSNKRLKIEIHPRKYWLIPLAASVITFLLLVAAVIYSEAVYYRYFAKIIILIKAAGF